MSATTESTQENEDEISPPLLVKIQTIELQNLDFQTNIGSTAKFRHLTYIEATNLFLFVGSTSGTVYVFSRDTLKFLFIIPFKGGKVCGIACSQDESDIAVGSIRGKVSIYRISPNVNYMQSSASAPLIDAFRDIYDVPHHVGSEITEMQWSPNGKYLFLGDSQGIVSQMDVACLDEFPRPVPSKVILKLQTRVLQIDCSFPFLAVCTLAAVFLCDLEKEDFTRVQCTKNQDIRSTGLCLMILPERSSLRDLARERTMPSAKLMLFIGEVGSGTIHCCNMEGNILYSRKITVSNKVSKYSMPFFDPTKATIKTAASCIENEEDSVNISLGKMLCTDDGMIVSVSSDRLFVYDPYTLNVIAWNEELNRINNFKIISNYAFIWSGNKFDVVAFTPFRSYAEQLFRAKLIGVLENWIVHTVYSLGYRGPSPTPEAAEGEETDGLNNGESTRALVQGSDENSEKAKKNFKKMMLSESEEESDFTLFVIRQLPFPLTLTRTITCGNSPDEEQEPVVPEEEIKKMEKPTQSFFTRIQTAFSSEPFVPLVSTSTQDNNRVSSALSLMLKKSAHSSGQSNNIYCKAFIEIWKALLVFYEDAECTLPQLDYKKSDLTLSHVLNSAQIFLSQPKLVNIRKEISEVVEISKFEDIAIQMIGSLSAQDSEIKKRTSELFTDSHSTNLPLLCFTKFTQCPVVIQWFRELGTSPEVLFIDGLITDTLLLLLPLCNENDSSLLSSCLDFIGVYDKLSNKFMTWLFLCKFLHKPKQVPYSPLLRSLLNEQLFEKLAEEMFSTIYRDFRMPSLGNSANYLHHFVSTLVLLSKSPDCSKPRTISILLSCFPLTRWAREDIVTKIIAACHLNPSLLGLYLKACLEDGNSMKLCGCGIQAGYGSLENNIGPWQRAIEEAIIKLLLEEYFKSSPYDDDDEDSDDKVLVQDGNGNSTQKRRTEMLVHMFAMRRGLLEPYYRSPLADEFLSEEIQAELIVRSGSCSSLKYYQCNQKNMSLLLRCLQNHNYVFNQSNTKGSPVTSYNSEVVTLSKHKHKRGEGKGPSKGSRKNIQAHERCKKCAVRLHRFSRDFKPLSLDCIGIWALKQVGSLDKLIELLENNIELNQPAKFSIRFYRATMNFNEGSLNHDYDLDSIEESSLLSCSNFH